jgi:hypothetical protein
MPWFGKKRSQESDPEEFSQIIRFSEPLRTGILNAFYELWQNLSDNRDWATQDKTAREIWKVYFENPLDQFSVDRCYALVRERIYDEAKPVPVLQELVTRIYNALPENVRLPNWKMARNFYMDETNAALSRYGAGWRIQEGMWIQVDSEVQNGQIVEVISTTKSYKSVEEKVKLALRELSDPENKDFGVSVVHAHTALEAMAVTLTGANTLSKAAEKLEHNGQPLHPALKKTLQALFGWASEQSNLRHGGEEISKIDRDLAKFALLTMFAFINFLESGNRNQWEESTNGRR